MERCYGEDGELIQAATEEVPTQMAAAQVAVCDDDGVCQICTRFDDGSVVCISEASAEPSTQMAEQACHPYFGCTDDNADGSKWIEQGGNTQLAARYMTCDGGSSGICMVCDHDEHGNQSNCVMVDGNTASREQRTMHANLRIGDPQPSGACSTTDVCGHASTEATPLPP